MMKKTRKTKIIATLGPSCSSPKTIEEMMLSGVDVFRINFSHANHSEIEKIISCFLTQEIAKAGDIDTAIINLTFEDGSMAVIDNCRKARPSRTYVW